MARPFKNTRYIYEKTFKRNADRIRVSTMTEPKRETVEEWRARMKGFGITDTQLDAFVEVRTIESFLEYCRSEDLDFAYIDAERVKQVKN